MKQKTDVDSIVCRSKIFHGVSKIPVFRGCGILELPLAWHHAPPVIAIVNSTE
jgi:hypothetical protein